VNPGAAVQGPWGAAARPAVALALAGALSALAVLPYALELMAPELRRLLPPLHVLLPAQFVQALVLMGLMSWIGLALGPGLGLDAPWLRHAVARLAGPAPAWRRPLVEAVAGAVIAVAAVAAVMALLDDRLPPMRVAEPPRPGPGIGLLASFYGAIGEEIQLRLFLVTLLAWLLVRGSRRRIGARPAIGIAVVLAALAFGAGHLPAAAQLWPLDAVVVARTLLANGAAGLVFGALYARRGLETAMASHFLADVALHVACPLLAGAAAS